MLLSIKYDQVLVGKFRGKAVSYISTLGILLFILPFGVLRGRAFYTYIERIIQISDGIKVMLQKPLLGIGPGNWQNIKYAYQSANYQTGYLHSGLIQIGLDGGFLATIVCLAIGVVVLKEFERKNLFKHLSIYVIVLHSLFDITLNFMAINFLLCILLSLIYPEPNQTIIDKHNRNWRWLLVVPLLFFMYLFSTQAWFNYIDTNLHFFTLEESINLCEKIRPYHFRSYSLNLLLAELYYQNNDYTQFVGQINSIPYKTAEVFYLEGKMELKAANYEGAIERAFRCIEASMHQENGYMLALVAIEQLPRVEQSKYRDSLANYWNVAQKEKHPLARFLPSK